MLLKVMFVGSFVGPCPPSTSLQMIDILIDRTILITGHTIVNGIGSTVEIVFPPSRIEGNGKRGIARQDPMSMS